MKTLQQKLIVLAMAISIFLCVLDTTVMNIALPAIQSGLNVDLSDLSWALNIYTITFAVFTIPLGRVADIFGRYKVFLVGLLLFLIGSALSGAAMNVPFLVTGRGIQSLGAAIIFPTGMTIGITSTSLQKRTGVVATLGIMQGLAAAMGPTIGGIITQYLGWRWVFMINLPLGILVGLLCLRYLNFKDEQRIAAQIDYAGMVLSMIMLFTLTLALINGNAWGWASPRIIGLSITSLSALILFVIVERHVKSPMIPLRLFRDRQFTGAALAVIITGIFLVAVMVILPTFFTKVQNHSELQAALMITPTSAMIFLFSPLSGFLIKKLGPRLVIFTGFISMLAGYGVLYIMDPNIYQQVVWACLLIGIGFGIVAGPIVVLGASDFTGELLTASQSVLGLFRQIGSVLAVAIFVSALTVNLTNAKTATIDQADRIINTLTINSAAKQTMKRQVQTQMAAEGGSTGSTKKKFISAQQEDTLIRTTYEKEIIKMQATGTILPATVKDKIHAQVAKNVKQAINKENQQMTAAVSQIKTTAKNNITNAFMMPYRQALVFLALASFICLLFDRKQPYQAKLASRSAK